MLKATTSNPIPGYLSWRNENVYFCKNLCINVSDSFICYSPKPMSHYSWMDEQAVVHNIKILGNNNVFWGKEMVRTSSHGLLHSFAGWKEPTWHLLIGADKKIPSWLIKITCWRKIKTTVRLGIKSKFGIMSFSTSDTILDLWFFY